MCPNLRGEHVSVVGLVRRRLQVQMIVLVGRRFIGNGRGTFLDESVEGRTSAAGGCGVRVRVFAVLTV